MQNIYYELFTPLSENYELRQGEEHKKKNIVMKNWNEGQGRRQKKHQTDSLCIAWLCFGKYSYLISLLHFLANAQKNK